MASSKKEREKQRRAYEARLRWEKQRETRRHRRNVVVGTLTASLVVIALVGWAVAAATNSVNPSTAAATTPAVNASVPATVPADTPQPTPTGTAPDPSLAEDRAWSGQIKTSVGTLDVTLDGKKAPQAVASFVSLAKEGYFDGIYCHRLTTGDTFKVLQCGDPTVKSADDVTKGGGGGPGYSFGPIENAPADQKYPAGTIAMARVGGNANSNGSQFFIVYGDTVIPNDQVGGYSVFGAVTKGLDAIEKVGASGTTTGATDGPPKTPVEIEKVSVK